MSDSNEGRVLSVHFGRSANCSSIGSIIDFLFLSTVAASAVVATTAVLLRDGAKEGDEPAEDEPSAADGSGDEEDEAEDSE